MPSYKGKGNKRDCTSYRGICLLTLPGKLFGRELIERVIQKTIHQMEDEHGAFRRG